MNTVETRTYVGPNVYANFKVIRFTLDLEALQEWPSDRIPGFVDRLVSAIPSLQEHGCSYREPGGFIRRLRDEGGTWMGHVLEHVAIELQNLAGARVTFGKTRTAGQPGRYHVVYEYEDPWVGDAAGRLALDLVHSLVPVELRGSYTVDTDFEFTTGLERLIRSAERRAFGPSTASLVRAAEARDIPWIRLNDASLVQFGHGHLQRRIQATITSETRHIAVDIASDKELTNRILGDIGLPVPKQDHVYSPEQAVRAARRIGFPVVVKPLDANHGRGVSIGMENAEQVTRAFGEARVHSGTVLVESFLQGFDHRMLVVNGALVAVAKRVPGHVVGNGVHTVAELVDLVNLDPRRGLGHEKSLTRLEFDTQAERLLAEAGVTKEHVLAAGQVFYLRTTGNLSTGGTAIDLTDDCHPDNREMAIRAAAAVGLDVCGVDFLTPDISQSFKEVGGGICEVNAAPGFRMHVSPSEGTPRDVAGAVLEMLFPNGSPSRIPIAAITGTNGKTTTTRMLAHIHKLVGHCVGMSTTDGVYIDGRLAVAGDMTGPASAKMVLCHPQVQVAVLETARGGLLRAGMGYKKPDVACCLNVASDHLGLGGVDDLDQLAEIKRIPIDIAQDTVVLNADDERCLRMAVSAVAKHVCYVTLNPSHALVREHIRAGGRAVALEAGVNGQMITIYDKGRHMPLLWTHLIPATLQGKAMHNVQNAMFAAAMAFAMNVKLDDIRHGLRTFDTSFFQTPGRMNVYDQLGFKVILDYGHNSAAVSAMVALTDALTSDPRPGRKRVVVLAAPGDRRNEDIREVARAAAGHFELYICRRDDNPRGRADREVPELLRDSLLEAGVPASQVIIADSEPAAIDHALSSCAPGDVLLCFVDQVTRSWKQVVYFGGRTPSEPSKPIAGAVDVEVELRAPMTDFAGMSVVRDGRGVLIAEQSD